MQISLVIPMKNESDSLESLVRSIEKQTFQPDEIVLVDGGSTDDTIGIAENLAAENPRIRLVKTPEASPGKGRNIGIDAARNDWVALTDAGIILENNWLENLVGTAESSPESELIYGTYSPLIKNLFEKCATISYVPALRSGSIRGKTVVSMLLKKTLWQKVGGFPDLRAAEDLMFMERAEATNCKFSFAPEAKVYWQLRPDFSSTFRKFTLYSKHNVWAGRAWDWHYGIAKQYLFVMPFIILAIFHSRWWLVGALVWLAARTAKRILAHRFEFGVTTLFNPFVFVMVALLVLTIDAATFTGWMQAVLNKTEN